MREEKLRRRYSKTYPQLPVDFEAGFEEYVYFGVLRYFELVQKNINKNIKETTINREAFKELADMDNLEKNAMEILGKNEIIDDVFIEGARLYVEDCLDYDPEFKEKLLFMSETFINDFYTYGIKAFFEKYYKIYGTCPICANFKEDRVYNEEDKQWYCSDCLKKM